VCLSLPVVLIAARLQLCRRG